MCCMPAVFHRITRPLKRARFGDVRLSATLINWLVVFVYVHSTWRVTHAGRAPCSCLSFAAHPPPATSHTAATTPAATSRSSRDSRCCATRRSNMAAPPGADVAFYSCRKNRAFNKFLLIAASRRRTRCWRLHLPALLWCRLVTWLICTGGDWLLSISYFNWFAVVRFRKWYRWMLFLMIHGLFAWQTRHVACSSYGLCGWHAVGVPFSLVLSSVSFRHSQQVTKCYWALCFYIKHTIAKKPRRGKYVQCVADHVSVVK